MITAVALVFALTLVPSETYAFGAGQIPENSRLHGAWRLVIHEHFSH